MAKKQATTKSGASGAGEKPMSNAEKNMLINKLVAIFWEQFGRGATLPVERDCFDRAVQLGALANIRTNLPQLVKFGAEFKQAEICSFRAGKRAKFLASKAMPRMRTITPDVYQQAFEYIAGNVAKAAKKSGSGPIRAQGLLCG